MSARTESPPPTTVNASVRRDGLARPPSSRRRSAATRRRPSGRSRRRCARRGSARRSARASPARCRGRASRPGRSSYGVTRRLGIRLERRRGYDVGRELRVEVERVLVAQLLGHLAADEHGVRAPPRLAEHADLVVDLRAAGDEHERSLDLSEQPAERLELALEQEAGVGGQEMRDALGRGVRTVRRAERVVDVEVAALGELAREALVVRRLARVEARVLEHVDALVGQSSSRSRAATGAIAYFARSSSSSAGRDASRRAPPPRPARARAAASAATRGCGCRRRHGRPRAARSGRSGPGRSCPRRRRREPSAGRAPLLPTPRRQPAASRRSSPRGRRAGSCSPTRCRTRRRP